MLMRVSSSFLLERNNVREYLAIDRSAWEMKLSSRKKKIGDLRS